MTPEDQEALMAELVRFMRHLRDTTPNAQAAWDELRRGLQEAEGHDIGEMPTQDEGWTSSNEHVQADPATLPRLLFYAVFFSGASPRGEFGR